MIHDRELFKELNEIVISKVRIGNGAHIDVKDIIHVWKLVFDVFYVLEINQNLLSVSHLLEKDYKVSFEHKICVIKDANNLEVFKVHMQGKSFF